MIACPSCNRRVFVPRDILYATMDGTAQCRACGQIARLGMGSRWLLSCVIAILLPPALLYGGLFYSGHLFVACLVLVLGAWRILSFITFPFLALEAVAGGRRIDRKQSIPVLALLLVAAIILDIFMSSRFEPADALDRGRPASAVRHDR